MGEQDLHQKVPQPEGKKGLTKRIQEHKRKLDLERIGGGVKRNMKKEGPPEDIEKGARERGPMWTVRKKKKYTNRKRLLKEAKTVRLDPKKRL